MDNIATKIEKGVLTITIMLNERGELSKSGKTRVIASTRGNALVAPNTYLGLNVFRYEGKD